MRRAFKSWSPVLLLAFPTFALGQEAYDPPTLRAVRLPEGTAIRVDGSLDEPQWLAAPIATGLHQREPVEGAPASEDTEVRVLHDGETLYIGIFAHDAEPERVIARILQRDRVMTADQFSSLPQFAGDDAVAILLDPFHDHRSAVIFATNPNGAEFEALLTDEGREFNVDWRGIWSVASRRTADGWSAEFAIPFRSLRYPDARDGEPWGFNVFRVVRRKNEEVLWSAWSRENEGFHRVSRAGHLEGLSQLPRTGLNLELKPYMLFGGSQEQEVSDIDTQHELEGGLDLKWEVRPGLLLDATVNTDFAQVEVDDEQVNLTRFDLFFPEKRDFFLENSGIFEFGWRSAFEPPPFLLFFSRRIGIADDGPVPVLGGARLSGRVGAHTIGVVNIVTDNASFPEEGTAEPRTNFAVARVKRDVGGTNYVGAMLADRRTADTWNTAAGADFSYWASRSLNLQGFGARTLTSDGEGNGSSYRLAADFQSDRLGITAGHLFVGPDATADMGFITRTDIRRTDAFVRLTPRPTALGLRKIDLLWFVQHIVRADWVAQDWQVGPAIGPEFESGDGFTVFAVKGFNRLDEGFDLREDDDPDVAVSVPAGDFNWSQFGFFVNSSANRPVVFTGFGFLWWNYGGHVHTASGTLTVNPSANLSVATAYTRNIVDVPNGAFTADIASLRLGFSLSTRFTVNTLAQYNSLDKKVSVNVRLNLIHRPGSDLFVVFNEIRGSTASPWDFSDRRAVVKVTYLARF